MPKYGNEPVDLGLVDLSPVEMMFWLYCPVKVPGGLPILPPNLHQFRRILDAVEADLFTCFAGRWAASYIYLTAKTLWVTHENPGNRRGWHSDGFMTNDLNYIWSDSRGTLFWTPEHRVDFTQDHLASLDEMEAVAEPGPHVVYPDMHLLRLDETVIHRVADFDAPGVRTFVKVSVSEHQYRLAGNSINHEIWLGDDYAPRADHRNPPESPTQKVLHD